MLSRVWNSRTIRQREDGWLSLTDMAQACGKLFADWKRLRSAEEYLKALELSHYGDSHNGRFLDVRVGGSPETTGAWGHRLVALEFARWLSPEFAIQCNAWVEELLLVGRVELSHSKAIAPVDQVEEVSKALSIAERYKEAFGGFNPTIEQSLKDLIGNVLLGQQAQLPGSRESWMGVVNFAELELGYSVPSKGEFRASSLGKWIRFYYPQLSDRQEKRLCNETQREIFVYPLHDCHDELTEAVEAFFSDPTPSTKMRLDGAYRRN